MSFDEFGEEEKPSPDQIITDAYELDEPRCSKCGSTQWAECILGDNNTIDRCSDCPSYRYDH